MKSGWSIQIGQMQGIFKNKVSEKDASPERVGVWKGGYAGR